MRILLPLLLLATISIVLTRWLGHGSPAPARPQTAQGGAMPPAAPTRPQDMKGFERDLNSFMQDTAERRARQEPQQ